MIPVGISHFEETYRILMLRLHICLTRVQFIALCSTHRRGLGDCLAEHLWMVLTVTHSRNEFYTHSPCARTDTQLKENFGEVILVVFWAFAGAGLSVDLCKSNYVSLSTRCMCSLKLALVGVFARHQQMLQFKLFSPLDSQLNIHSVHFTYNIL